MPYINPDNARPRLDPSINALAQHLLERTANEERGAGKCFFFSFLTLLHGTLSLQIEERSKTLLYYGDYQDLGGAFDYATKELYRRWREVVPLNLYPLDDMLFEEFVGKFVTEEDSDRLCGLIANIAHTYSVLPRLWGGEVNYTITEVANLLANALRATPQELLDVAHLATDYIYSTQVGPYEDGVILKNGDTAGFKTFFLKWSTDLA